MLQVVPVTDNPELTQILAAEPNDNNAHINNMLLN